MYRSRPGVRHHLLAEATGIPLSWSMTSASRRDITQVVALLDAVQPIPGRAGRQIRRPVDPSVDRAYDRPPQGMPSGPRASAP